MPKATANREILLERGFHLLYTQGVSATGVKEITDAAGVPKGSFYNYFDSKDAFVIEALKLYETNLLDHLDNQLINSEEPPLQRLRTLFEDWADLFDQEEGKPGCFAGNLSQELALENPPIRSALFQVFTSLQRRYVDCLEAAQADGSLSHSQDPSVLGQFIYNGWQGAILRAKSSDSSEPMRVFIGIVFDQLLKSTG